MSRYFVFWYSKDDVKLFWSVELRWVMWSPGLLFWYFFFLGNVWNSCLLHNYFRCTYFTILSSFKDKLPTHIMKILFGRSVKNIWVETSWYRVIKGFTFPFQVSCVCTTVPRCKRILGRCSASRSHAEIINKTHSLTL